MPIMSDGTLQYELPDKYRKLLTKEFLERFYNALCSLFQYVESNTLAWNYCEGTFGWYDSLRNTIESVADNKEEYSEMLKYYDDLPWYDSDMFDSELTAAAVKAGIITDEALQE